jgi:hypothetical protein
MELTRFMNISQEELLEILMEIHLIGSETDFLLLEDFLAVIQNKLYRVLESNRPWS